MNIKSFFTCCLLLAAVSQTALAQDNGVGIGTTSPHPSAILDVTASNQGVLLPRLNNSQESSISAPLQGLLYYNVNLNRFKMYDGFNYLTVLTQEPTGRVHMFQAGAISNYLDYGTGGVTGPDEAAGWKIRLWGSGDLTNGANFGLGIDDGTIWYATASLHKWYVANNEAMRLESNGRLIPAGGVYARGGAPGAFGASNNGFAFLNNGGANGGSDEGLYSLADNQVNIFTNNAERVRITGSQVRVFGGILARGGAPGGNGANTNGYAFEGNSGDNDSGVFSTTNGEVSMYTNSLERLEVTDGSVNVKTNLRVNSGYPIEIRNYGNANGRNTGYPVSEWNAIVGGFATSSGDINEDGAGSIISCYMYVATPAGTTVPTWHISADFRSHNTHEAWSVNVMFMRKEMSYRFDNP